jgi:iron complex outermembrane receptor protein
LSTLYQDLKANGYTQQDDYTASTKPIYGQDKYSNYYNAGNETTYRIASSSVEYDFGPVASITNVSYVKQTTALDIDFTNVYLPLVAALVPPDTGVPGLFLSDLSKWTIDSHLVSKRLGPVEFMVGAYYTNELNNFQPGIFLANESTGQYLPPPFSALVSQQNLNTYKEHAFYGDLTYYITDRLDIQGGARYSDNSQTIDATKVGLLLGLAAPQTFNYDFSGSVMTYLATLRWRFNDSISTYVRAASGYRPGGPLTSPVAPPNTPTTVKPDSDWNYEVGLNGAFFNNKLNITTSIYHIDWKDIQLQGLSNGIQYQTNGGTAEVDGAELQIDSRLSQHLTVGVVAGYTDPRMERVSAAAAAGIGARPGDPLPLTPRYTAASTADYNVPLTASLKGTVGATLRYRSNMPTSFSGDPLNNNIDLGSLTTADFRAGIILGNINFALRVANVFDRRGFVSSTDRRAAPLPTPVWAVPNQPRTFTLGASSSF